MDLSAPYRAVMSKAEGAVLSVLAGTQRPMTGREVARISGAARSTVSRILRGLADHGLVNTDAAGAATMYTLNREHLAAEPIVALVRLRGRLVERLADEIEGWTVSPRHASLFGSAARGDGGVDSDVDVFLVRPTGVDEEHADWRNGADSLPSLVHAWTGNHASIAEVPERDVPHLVQERSGFVQELQRDTVTVAGVALRELIAEHKPSIPARGLEPRTAVGMRRVPAWRPHSDSWTLLRWWKPKTREAFAARRLLWSY